MNARGIKELFGFQDGVERAKDAHGEDDVGVFAAFEEVAEDVVGDAPDEGDYVAGWEWAGLIVSPIGWRKAAGGI